MVIRKILFPTKFRELAFNCLESLFVLKDAGLEEVVLCHIIEREKVGFVPYGGYLKEEAEKLQEEARIRFHDWQEALSGQGIESRLLIKVGDPLHEITVAAEEEKPDLMVVGRKKRKLKEAFAGSRTIEILRRSPVPVLVNKYMVQFEWNEEVVTRTNDRIFEKPLLATDFTEPSEHALNLLLSLKKVMKEAVVCHVVDVKEEGAGAEEADTLKLEEYRRRLEDEGIKAEVHLSAGQTADEIMSVARGTHSTLVLMGTTGKTRLKEFWTKSVSHDIAKTSELPTLLVR
ncbi:MAG: universal stress protein [Thermodesulfovibrionales bacterium]